MKQSIWNPLILMLILALSFVFLYNLAVGQIEGQVPEITYSRFRLELAADNINKSP